MPSRSGNGAVASMTGYAQARAQAEDWDLQVTLKSVNHRFLDLRWQVPDELEGLVATFDKQLRTRLHRGHVDIRIAVDSGSAAAGARLDPRLLEAYLAAHAELSRRLSRRTPPQVADLLRHPGMLTASHAAPLPESAHPALVDAFAQALAQLDQMRGQEGAALARDLTARLERLAGAVAQIAAQRGELETALLERLRARLAELLPTPLAPDRLLQEAAVVAERSDVSEELTRLEAHLAQFRALLAAGGEIGKKLDFLTQELNREANTLLSKTTSATPAGLRLSQLGLEMKSEIEKIREQVQNLE